MRYETLFTPYERVREEARQWQADEASTRRLDSVPWCVTEKIHGANLCLLTDGQTLRVARRKALLQPHERFFDYQRVIERLGDAPHRLHAALAARMGWAAGQGVALIYGELFGGHYPHPDVAPVPGVAPVQTGVWYAPDVRFWAFDVAISVDGAAPRYLSVEDAVALCDDARLPTVPIQRVCTYAEALAAPFRFDTEVPARLRLPPLDGPNLAEGIVIKPWRHIELSGAAGVVRPALKLKPPEFAEARFHQATAWGTPATLDLSVLEWALLGRLTPARVDAALSKLGDPAQVTDADWAREVIEDVWQDVAEAHPGARHLLDAESRALLDAVVVEEALERIRAARAARLALAPGA